MDYNYLIWTMVQSHKTGRPLGMNTHLGIVNLLRRNRKSTSGDAVAKIVLVPERASNIFSETDFKWGHLQGEAILRGVRWYCQYGVSYRNLERMGRLSRSFHDLSGRPEVRAGD